ncbi:TIGR03086 family metal-binding protein [Mycobacterium sp. E2497]|uniref:TIGR03086 family metal-binding protein n=1 Tax=Mycobacterium sp. E2497 TaxID=1834135 RepID=UPI0007FCD75B|nr:TIGR03086 family metal-binding protein [Mycobacterium sp. E2497]OBI22587.1 TIGR03086 family protein [Mycobacterium sp. E2497]
MPFADQAHLARAAHAVDDLLAHLAGDQWMAPTPCTGWSVARVAQHLVDVNFEFAQQLDPVGTQTVTSASTSGDLLGRYRRSAETLQQALIGAGDPAVDIPAQLRSRLALRVADLLIHGWDIAVATGIPLHLEEDLCLEALAFAESRSAALQRSGEFAPPQPIDKHAPAIDQLAALSGRTPPSPREHVRSPSTPNEQPEPHW